MSDRPVYLGIDLGTTNSAAALFDGQAVSMVRNAQGGNLTPSVVRIDGKGAVTVGGKARRFLESDPSNTRAEFKRLMGTSTAIEFASAKVTKRPEELAAIILSSLVADVREMLGFAPEQAVITVPALFEVPQSAATSEAARLAGLKKVELIQEPIASAIAAGWKASDQAGKWLVYDLGGGTFDASLLETSEGFLRVVGHEGDNFLGGRDVDLAIVEWAAMELERATGVKVSRSDSAQAGVVRKLKQAAEEAKIELSRAKQASLSIASLIDGHDLDLELDRDTLERLAMPVIERSILVCRRLLDRHGVKQGELTRLVMVGGPTAMPFLRQRVAEALAARLAEGLDPMTLVAQGAAIFAATAGLDGRPATREDDRAHKLALHYPAMSADLRPHVVGKVLDNGKAKIDRVRLVREGFETPYEKLDDSAAFVLSVELESMASHVFKIEAVTASGEPVPVSPKSITIVQGLTINEPPLSRSIGVALANDLVQVYFERGSPLPSRRTFKHQTVEGVARGSGNAVLRIPLVQGDMPRAHLCRLIGALEIGGHELSASLPLGAEVELSLEVDRGGKLSARAYIPSLSQTFESVAHLLVPEASLESLSSGLEASRARLSSLRSDAFRRSDAHALKRLAHAEGELGQAARDIAAARGGDADAGQKARRTLLEVEGLLDEADLEKSWPELDDRARQMVGRAAYWVAMLGTEVEKRYLAEATASVEKARERRDPVELERQLKAVRDLYMAAYYRDPSSWANELDYLRSHLDSCTDLPKAKRLIEEAEKHLAKNDIAQVKSAVQSLWRLLPVDAQERKQGYDSGVV